MFAWPSLSDERIFISFSQVLASKTSVTDFDRSAILGWSFSIVNHLSAYLRDLQNKTPLQIRILTDRFV